jgi:Rad3-related DNA helicase
MDFPGESCRVEVLPEVPVATSDLEEFVSAYLRDAPFAATRFGQRVAQALGRCNREENDRAVYILDDAEFLSRFSQQRLLDTLPDDVRGDVFAGIERSDRGFAAGLADADRLLDGEDVNPL